MARSKSTTHTRDRPEGRATATFAVLDLALAKGDYAAAGRAQASLNELGWVVRRRLTYAQLLGPVSNGTSDPE